MGNIRAVAKETRPSPNSPLKSGGARGGLGGGSLVQSEPTTHPILPFTELHPQL